MSLELRVSGGTRDGQRLWFSEPLVLLGRDPRADLAFDAQRDRDVSARHAELRRRGGRWTVRDLNSTNGTYLNGARVEGEAELRDGDRIGCGAHGPVVTVHIPQAVGAVADATAPRAADASPPPTPPPRARRRRAPLVAALALLVLAGGAGAALVAARRDAQPTDTASAASSAAPSVDGLLRRADSVHAMAAPAGAGGDLRPEGLDSALARERRASDELRRQLAELQRTGQATAPAALTQRLESLERRAAMLAGGDRIDFARIARQNGAAVAIVAVEDAQGDRSSGTAFGVHRGGVLVTNRHVVLGTDGEAPRRVLVQFDGSREWLPARVAGAADDADLALLQVEGGAPIPVVHGVAAAGTEPGVGDGVALIGFPLGFDLPMDEQEGARTARSTLGVGVVSKALAGVLQIDAFAGHGSSGSPVFDRRGAVVGVVYGGARESEGRVVLAVPAARLRELLPDSLALRVR